MKKTTVFKQALSHLVVHSVACLFIFLVMVPIIGGVASYPLLSLCVSVVMAVVYAGVLFGKSYECAYSDYKTYSKLKPYPLKGFVLSLGVIIPVVIVWVFYVIAWKVAPIPETASSEAQIPLLTFSANILYSFITAPFWNLVDIKGSNASLTGQIITLAVPAAACFAGYYFGYIKVDFTKYFNKLMYEKKKK